MRSILLWMARNQWLRERLPKLWFARRAVRRFMPGEDAGFARSRPRQGSRPTGIAAMFTRLGENVTTVEEGDAVAEHYLGLLDDDPERGTRRRGLASSSPSWATTSTSTGRSRTASASPSKAASPGRTLWIDMEGSAYADGTLAFYERLKATHPNTGHVPPGVPPSDGGRHPAPPAARTRRSGS